MAVAADVVPATEYMLQIYGNSICDENTSAAQSFEMSKYRSYKTMDCNGEGSVRV